MFVQTQNTPNPNSLKFLPGKNVSNKGSFEITQKDQTNNELVKNLLSINGVEGIFLGKDFISINKYDDVEWEYTDCLNAARKVMNFHDDSEKELEFTYMVNDNLMTVWLMIFCELGSA